MYCAYYQAQVLQSKTWFFVATLRAHEHIAFDRTFDKTTGVFEFFVPQAREHEFVELMAYYEREGIVSNVKKLENRLAQPGSTL